MTWVALASVLAGCRGWRGDTYLRHRLPKSRAAKEATYRFGLPGPAWREVRNADEVQVAWTNAALGAVITIHAQCAEQGDSSLSQYTDHLSMDWTHWKIVAQTPEKMIGRDALRTTVDAELDGVPRRNEFVVLKKNGCLFDLQYSARPDAFASGRAAFDAVVAGFRFPVEG